MIKIFLKPIVSSLEEDDDILLFEQGIFIDDMEVDDGETFIIPEGVFGKVFFDDVESLKVCSNVDDVGICMQKYYYLKKGEDLGEGTYLFKGNLLLKILN